MADMRSSSEVKKGTILLIMPISDDWNGSPIHSYYIRKSEETFEATVHRIGARGEFQIRILSDAEQNFLSRFKAGKTGLSLLDTEISSAGLVTTIKLIGQLGVDTTGIIQTEIRKIRARLIMIDFTNLSSINRAATAVLAVLLKQEMPQRHFAFLTKPSSEIHSILIASRIITIGQVFTNRESAVTYLLQEDLD